MSNNRPLNLSEAVDIMRALSRGLHKQETLSSVLTPLNAELDKAWVELTAFVEDYGNWEVAMKASEAKYRATVEAMFNRHRED